MKKAAVITTPFPTPEQVARSLGVTARRLKQLRKLVEAERKADPPVDPASSL